MQGVFEKFKQVAKDRRGLGLGLYISKGIVEAHGGCMWAESQPASGSTVHFAIPRLHLSHGGVVARDAGALVTAEPGFARFSD